MSNRSMFSSRCVLTRCACFALVLVAALTRARGATIVGYDSVGTQPGNGLLYSVNAQTGDVTPIGNGSGIAMSSGPVANTILYSSGVNTYEVNVVSGTRKLYVCTQDPCSTVGDHAFDSGADTVFALALLYPLGEGYPNPVTALFRLIDFGVAEPGIPESTVVGYSLVGVLGVSDIDVIEYVPGIGLIGTDGYNALYRIDSTDGHATLLGPLFIVLPEDGGITPMNGLAYDPDTRRLIGSAPAGIGPGGVGLPRLYSIEIAAGHPAFGAAGWLNEAPPSLTGIATVHPTPEPGTAALWALGFAAGLFHGRRRKEA